MFLSLTDGGYIEEGENEGAQFAEGTFLMIAEDPSAPVAATTPELRALVIEDVRMEQLGHFMMGEVQISEGVETLGTLTLSGPFGGDTLPVHLAHKEGIDAEALWSKMHPIPGEVVEAFWKNQHRLVQHWGQANAHELALWVIEAEFEGEDKEDGKPKKA